MMVRTRRRDPRLLAAAIVVPVIVTALVVTLGLERPPRVEPVRPEAAGAPDAAVAWSVWGGREGSCIEVARPDGSTGRLTCLPDGGELVGWDRDGIHFRSWSGPEPVLVTLDPATGEVLARRRDPLVEESFPLAQGVRTRRSDGELVVTLERDGTELWRVPAGRAYDVSTGARSPDGRWVAMVDRARRLLVVPADGGSEPLLWARSAAEWTPPVWEGTQLRHVGSEG